MEYIVDIIKDSRFASKDENTITIGLFKGGECVGRCKCGNDFYLIEEQVDTTLLAIYVLPIDRAGLKKGNILSFNANIDTHVTKLWRNGCITQSIINASNDKEAKLIFLKQDFKY